MLSCCRDQIQEVIFFLERVQGHRERLSFSEQMAPASWGERVSLDSTLPGSMKPLTQFLRKLVFVAVFPLTRTVAGASLVFLNLSDGCTWQGSRRQPQQQQRPHSAPVVRVGCTAAPGGLPPESFPDTLCYTLKVDSLDTGSGVDRMLREHADNPGG